MSRLVYGIQRLYSVSRLVRFTEAIHSEQTSTVYSGRTQ